MEEKCAEQESTGPQEGLSVAVVLNQILKFRNSLNLAIGFDLNKEKRKKKKQNSTHQKRHTKCTSHPHLVAACCRLTSMLGIDFGVHYGYQHSGLVFFFFFTV